MFTNKFSFLFRATWNNTCWHTKSATCHLASTRVKMTANRARTGAHLLTRWTWNDRHLLILRLRSRTPHQLICHRCLNDLPVRYKRLTFYMYTLCEVVTHVYTLTCIHKRSIYTDRYIRTITHFYSMYSYWPLTYLLMTEWSNGCSYISILPSSVIDVKKQVSNIHDILFTYICDFRWQPKRFVHLIAK